jgi:hypothetical protein
VSRPCEGEPQGLKPRPPRSTRHWKHDGVVNGNNERMVGAALKDLRKKVIISSKSPAQAKAQLLADLDTSLRELGTEAPVVRTSEASVRARPRTVPGDASVGQRYPLPRLQLLFLQMRLWCGRPRQADAHPGNAGVAGGRRDEGLFFLSGDHRRFVSL